MSWLSSSPSIVLLYFILTTLAFIIKHGSSRDAKHNIALSNFTTLMFVPSNVIALEFAKHNIALFYFTSLCLPSNMVALKFAKHNIALFLQL